LERDPIELGFAQHTSAECARGITILDGRRLGKGLKDWCGRQDRFGWICEGVAVQGVRNFRIPSLLRPEACRTFVLSAPESTGRLLQIFHQPWSISQYLDHRFPLLVTLFGNIGWPFLFSHRSSPSYSQSSLSAKGVDKE
jgi:hypothetical protein